MATSKRVVHLLHTLDPGGCEHMLLSLLPHLQKEGWEVHVLTLGKGGTLAPRFKAAGIAVHSQIFRSAYDIVGFARLKKLLQQLSPGLVVAHLLYADALVRVFRGNLFGIPALPVIHSTYNSHGLWKARLFERLTAPLIQKAIAVSPAVKTISIKRGLKEENIFLIPNPINSRQFYPVGTEEKFKLRKTLGISEEATVVTCVANFIDYKRHIDLVEAFKIALQTHPELELCLVGHGKEEPTIRLLIEKERLNKKIHFLGQRQDVPEILRASDIFVLPSLFEGMSVAIMEAMASGLPVIASDIPENRVLLKEGVTGMLTPVKNPQALATVLTRISRDHTLQEKIGRDAQQFIDTYYSLPVVTTYWEDLYQQLTKI